MGESKSEFEQLRTIEEELRLFVAYYDQHVEAAEQRGSRHHPFAPRTVRMVAEVKPSLERLDQLRKAVEVKN